MTHQGDFFLFRGSWLVVLVENILFFMSSLKIHRQQQQQRQTIETPQTFRHCTKMTPPPSPPPIIIVIIKKSALKSHFHWVGSIHHYCSGREGGGWAAGCKQHEVGLAEEQPGNQTGTGTGSQGSHSASPCSPLQSSLHSFHAPVFSS